MILPRNVQLKTRSRELRRAATREERHLWYDFLRVHRYQFYRQRVIGGYIVDFYCDKLKLAIELDGSQHYDDDAIVYDRVRTEYLNSLGVEVVRFTNVDVNCNFNEVCKAIEACICQHEEK